MFQGDDSNILYPFGPDSIRYVGDVWTIEADGEHTGKTFSFEEFEGTRKSTITYNFKKIKEKRGSKIAYIKFDNAVELIGVGASDDKSIDLTIVTTVSGDVKYNITTGLTESQKGKIKSYSKKIPILISSNMSLGAVSYPHLRAHET